MCFHYSLHSVAQTLDYSGEAEMMRKRMKKTAWMAARGRESAGGRQDHVGHCGEAHDAMHCCDNDNAGGKKKGRTEECCRKMSVMQQWM